MTRSKASTRMLGSTVSCWADSGTEIRLMTPTVHAAEVVDHVHTEAHFIIVLSGRYRSSADHSIDVDLGPQIIFNPPGTRHRDCFHEDQLLDDASFLSLMISPLRWQALTAEAGLPGWAVAEHGPGAVHAAAALHQALEARDPLAAEAVIAELAARFTTRFAEREAALPPWLAKLRRSLDEIAAEPSEAVRHSQLAAQCGVHPVHLARAFRRHYRCSPAQYLRARRLDQAAALLQHSSRPLSQIALDAGFHDQPHFTRAFATRFGRTPGQYRALRQTTSTLALSG